MFRLLSRSRRLAALLAAGVLGIAPLAAAPKAPLAAPVRPASSNRTEEVQVELAWLADPATFRCPLRARAAGSVIEVSGPVPRAEVRTQAVKIAHAASGKSVRDAITVSRAMGGASTPPTRPDLMLSAARAVLEPLGPQARAAQLTAGEKGAIVLCGHGLSLEDRHRFSTRLRLVRGCSCVVSGSEQPEAAPRVATAPRPMPAVAAKPMPAPATVAKPAPFVKPMAATVPAAKAAPAVKPMAATVPAAQPKLSPEKSGIQRISWLSPYSTQAEPDDTTAGKSGPEKKPAAPIALSSSSPYGRGLPSLDLPAEPTVTSHSPWAPAKVASRPSTKLVSSTESASAPKAEPLTLIEAPSMMQVTPIRSTVSSVPVKRAAPRGLFAFLHRGTPARNKPVAVTGSSTPDRLDVTAEAEPLTLVEAPAMPRVTPARSVVSPPAELVSSAPAERPAPRGIFAMLRRETPAKGKPAAVSHPGMPDRPYVTTGTVTFHDEGTAKDSEPVKTSLPSSEDLRQKVLIACGGAVKDVAVKPLPDNSTQVTLRVTSGKAIDALYSKLLQLPEMQSPGVHLHVEVMP